MRIPFDSLVLASVTAELQILVGGKAQRVVSLDPSTIALAIYSDGRERWLALSCDATYARVHLISERPRNPQTADTFVKLVRSNLDGARLRDVKQVGFDRVLHLDFEREDGRFRLIAELMGKHSNLILVGPDGRIVACAKSVGSTKSSRPVLVGRTYAPPPFEPRRPVWEARSESALKTAEGASPFLLKLLRANANDEFEGIIVQLKDLEQRISSGRFEPVTTDIGAYPISVERLGLEERTLSSMSFGIERGFAAQANISRLETARSSLIGQLERAALAKDVAIHDLTQAVDAATRASEMQTRGELILAYQRSIEPGDSVLEATDYSGRPISIPLNPEKTPIENAQRWFEKAKKAKSGAVAAHDQLVRISADRADLELAMNVVRESDDVIKIDAIREQATSKRWLHVQRAAPAGPGSDAKPSDPFDGHKIRTLVGPGNVSVLYGENATSNDFLTLRVAKPNDWWLHVRGQTSAHVVIQTHNQPTKIGMEVLRFAAEVAVRNSAMKHSGYVPVDYTLKKYVRKPKGGPVGTALYTHEKTIHVDLSKSK